MKHPIRIHNGLHIPRHPVPATPVRPAYPLMTLAACLSIGILFLAVTA